MLPAVGHLAVQLFYFTLFCIVLHFSLSYNRFLISALLLLTNFSTNFQEILLFKWMSIVL
jgi:hypothetical protein